MSRPCRSRQIDGYPDHWSFSPDDFDDESPGPECIILTLDEYETIRLLDREYLTQEQCAGRMGVSRTTVTSIYESARRKLAEALVDGKRLRIAGGNYQIGMDIGNNVKRKDCGVMRIAVSYDNGKIFLHFGRTEQFKFYDTEDGKITAEQVVSTEGKGHGQLISLLKAAGVDAVICYGVGTGARTALEEAGIQIYAGVTGSADEAANALAAGNLQCDPDAHCAVRGHHEHSCYSEHPHDCDHHEE